MSYQYLICDRQDEIATITLNRPDKKNALSTPLRDEIIACFDALASERTRAIIITGAGETFCAGFDLAEFTTGDPAAIFAHATAYHHKVYNSPVPTIAAVNGAAYAGGLDLAAMCDLRIAVTTARFAQPQVRMGIPAAFELMKTVFPEPVARQLCLTGEPLTASQALGAGFLNQVCEADQLMSRATELATAVAAAKGSTAMRAKIVSAQQNLFE
ncbi:MAG: enoyl-CoA hydratase/isomerase family protein [Pseudomonadales bacterium]|nr:enoyl-CoA hydratase/isomerase family protein [Pseudomonadales bacterium]